MNKHHVHTVGRDIPLKGKRRQLTFSIGRAHGYYIESIRYELFSYSMHFVIIHAVAI